MSIGKRGLVVSAAFRTVQGEGALAGWPAVFVRLAGCNLWDGSPEHRDSGKGACAAWCDASFRHGDRVTDDEATSLVCELWGTRRGGGRLVVLTGGEPTLQLGSSMLVRSLAVDLGFRVAVETNGTVSRSRWDPDRVASWVTVSPKLGCELAALDLLQADELKVVLPGTTSGDGWTDGALDMLTERTETPNLFVQPQDPVSLTDIERSYLQPLGAGLGGGRGDGEASYRMAVERCVSFVLSHPRWRVSFQAHKLLGLP